MISEWKRALRSKYCIFLSDSKVPPGIPASTMYLSNLISTLPSLTHPNCSSCPHAILPLNSECLLPTLHPSTPNPPILSALWSHTQLPCPLTRLPGPSLWCNGFSSGILQMFSYTLHMITFDCFVCVLKLLTCVLLSCIWLSSLRAVPTI